jgi:hypothetical protein
MHSPEVSRPCAACCINRCRWTNVTGVTPSFHGTAPDAVARHLCVQWRVQQHTCTHTSADVAVMDAASAGNHKCVVCAAAACVPC